MIEALLNFHFITHWISWLSSFLRFNILTNAQDTLLFISILLLPQVELHVFSFVYVIIIIHLTLHDMQT